MQPRAVLRRSSRFGGWSLAVFLAFGLFFNVVAGAAEPGFQARPLPALAAGRPGFHLMSAADTGVDFTNRLDLARGLLNQNLMNGSGVAAGDVDGDGQCDLYFCGLDENNRLYRNLGAWKFQDITDSAGVACPNQDSTGAVLVDLDGDGRLDLLVTALGKGVRLFMNDGRSRFRETTDEAGLRSQAGATSMALTDIDADGDLDLYVTCIPRRPVRNELAVSYQIKEVNGERQVVAISGTPTTAPELAGRFKVTPSGEVLEYGEPDQLFLNNGHAHFTLVSFTDGRFLDENNRALTETPMDWGLSAQFHDLNDDQLPDLYVCNDLFTPDRIWINQGGGRFKALNALAVRHTSLASMGVDVADVNRDGSYDLFISDMFSLDRRLRITQFAHVPPRMWEDGVIGERLQFNHNTLLLNRGDLTFADVAFFSGVAASDWSWGGVFLDVDLDGFEDLLVPTGQQRNLAHGDFAARTAAFQRGRGKMTVQDILKVADAFPPLDVPNMAFRNRGDLTFEECGRAWGFDTRGASQGLALADLDNDGDLDVIVNNLLQPAGLYRNESAAPRVAVRLIGEGQNRAGIGAQIRVGGGPVPQQQEMICGGRYLSSDQALRTFATGPAKSVTLEVLWPSGRKSFIQEAAPNCEYVLVEARAGSAPPLSRPPTPAPFFVDASDRLKHTHAEASFNDLALQPLLPFRLSRSGPGITCFDLNGDGGDDLLIPGGQGGAMAAFLNRGDGTFRRVSLRAATETLPLDQSAVLGWLPGSTSAVLVATLSSYKPAAVRDSPALSFFNLAKATVAAALPALDGPVGPVCMADVDGDGDLDLFVGTLSPPGRNPEPGTGYLFHNEDSAMVLMEKWEKLGVIKNAIFSDLDQDGLPELAVACEWGPLRVFANEKGRFRDATEAWGLLDQTGLWQGIAAGDFDGDGRMDLVASNCGLNTHLAASRQAPKIFYYGDVNDDSALEIFEIAVDPQTGREHLANNLNLTGRAVPFVRERAPDYETYSRLTIQELLADGFSKLTRLEVRNLASTVFLNRGGHFEARPLPNEAQFTPAYGIAIADFDGDGHEDLFLSQNCFVTGMGMTRQDAGRGLWLRGNGSGGFQAVPAHQSGLIMYGEQRGCAVSDFDRDGRPDLVVAQNNAETKLYLNRQGAPGLRVDLRGPPGNSRGIGGVIQLGREDRWGPARELHAGGGYWSVDTAAPVLPRVGVPDKVRVRWPGGAVSTAALLPDVRQVEVSYPSPP